MFREEILQLDDVGELKDVDGGNAQETDNAQCTYPQHAWFFHETHLLLMQPFPLPKPQKKELILCLHRHNDENINPVESKRKLLQRATGDFEGCTR